MPMKLIIRSFDPMTNGHLDMIERAGKLFDKLYVGCSTIPTNKASPVEKP